MESCVRSGSEKDFDEPTGERNDPAALDILD